jgi:N-acetylmuramoyl-L-alanine amidase
MPKVHVVKQGECLSAIAARHGYSDYKAIYEDAANEAFRKKRPNPHVLFPGDELVLPERPVQSLEVATGAVHRFRVNRPRRTRTLQLKLQDSAGEALGDMPWRLELGGELEPLAGTSDAAGMLTAELPAHLTEVMLYLGRLGRRLQLGALNPLRDTADGGITGVQARLRNLGYATGPVDGACGPRTQAAIRAFQRDRGLAETGELDDGLLSALERQHEC